MPRGGSRPGAGRKADPNSKRQQKAVKRERPPQGHAPTGANLAAGPLGDENHKPAPDLSNLTPLDYLLQVVRDPAKEERIRIQAASIAAPYCHPKQGEGTGKKAQAGERAKQAAGGKFGARPAPLKLVGGG